MEKSFKVMIIIVAVLGYGSGMGAEFLIEGEMSKVQHLINNAGFEIKTFSIIKSAEMSSIMQNILDSASIGFIVGPMLQDPDEILDSGDEFFINKINECKFHSFEDIDGTFFLNNDGFQNELDNLDDGVCIICKVFDMDGDLLTEGEINLENGYMASDTISIPIPHAFNVIDINTIELAIESAILDFSGIPTGDTLSDQYLIPSGIDIMGFACSDSSCSSLDPLGPQVFDTNAAGTPDSDLEVDVGKIAIIPHDDNNDGVPDLPANDSPHGGDQFYKLTPKRYVNSLIFVDADRGGIGNDIGDVIAYRDLACTDEIKKVDILATGDGTTQVLVMMNAEKVSCLKVSYRDSGGVASFNFGCPLPGEEPWLGEGCTPGFWKQSHHFQFWTNYQPSDNYGTVFGLDPGDPNANLTLLQALQNGGGGFDALGRHAVAALLDAASPVVDYPFSEQSVIDEVQAAYADGDPETHKDILAAMNEAGCPIGGH